MYRWKKTSFPGRFSLALEVGRPTSKGDEAVTEKFLATPLLRHTTNLVPDLPRWRKREISLFRVRQSEIWVRDYPVAFCHQTIHTSVTTGIPLLKRKLLTNINQGAYKKYVYRFLQLYSVLKITERSSKRQEIDQFSIYIFFSLFKIFQFLGNNLFRQDRIESVISFSCGENLNV